MQTRTSCASKSLGSSSRWLSGIEETNRIGGHHRNSAGGGQADALVQVVALLGPSHAVQLQVEAPGKPVQPLIEDSGGPLRPVTQERPANLAVLASGQCDQPIQRIRFKPALEHEHLAPALSARVRETQQATQVVESGRVRTEQRQAGRHSVPRRFRDPDVGADQGLEAVFDGRLVELHHREDVHVVGEGHRWHPLRTHAFGQLGDANDPVHEGILAVNRKVDEATHVRRFIPARFLASLT